MLPNYARKLSTELPLKTSCSVFYVVLKNIKCLVGAKTDLIKTRTSRVGIKYYNYVTRPKHYPSIKYGGRVQSTLGEQSCECI
jgi:hypothetical protein